MKKLLALLLIAISISSCENDSESPVVGTWKVKKVINAGVAYTTLGECDLNSYYRFYNNARFESYGDFVSSEGEICMLYGAMKWHKAGSVFQIMNNSNAVLGEVVKVSRDTLMLQNLPGYDSSFKKILVKQ